MKPFLPKLLAVLTVFFFTLLTNSQLSWAENLTLPTHSTPDWLNQNSPKTFLTPEKAFQMDILDGSSDQDKIIHFSPAPGYYLYRDRVHVLNHASDPVTLKFPTAESKQDPSFGQVWIYRHPFDVQATFPDSDNNTILIEYQGCADHGICYPPTQRTYQQNRLTGNFELVATDDPTGAIVPAQDSTNPLDYLQLLKSNQHLWFILSAFFGVGLLLAITPCVFPMFPILSSIIVGEGTELSKSRGFVLALTYVLGMAITYSIMGSFAGLSGTLLSNVLQTPPVQIGTALLFFILALSMFDVWTLQIPSQWQTGLHSLNQKLPGGKLTGVALMGALSALVIGPCVAAPLAGGLLYIAQTHDWVLGGLALFFLSFGMGTPLIVIGTSAGTLLPKAGPWMHKIKSLFGVALIGVGVWMVWPLLKPHETPGLPFATITENRQLDQALTLAQRNHQPVLIDFYADWCISCVEIEKKVLNNSRVASALKSFSLIRVDVTKTTQDSKTLLSRFHLFGPPGLYFYTKTGEPAPVPPIVGTLTVHDMLKDIKLTLEGTGSLSSNTVDNVSTH